MASPVKNLQAEGKQFRLVKFFAFASVIVLIIFSFPLSVVISQQAKDILTKSYENYALLQGQNLNHQVYQNFITLDDPTEDNYIHLYLARNTKCIVRASIGLQGFVTDHWMLNHMIQLDETQPRSVSDMKNEVQEAHMKDMRSM